LSATPAGSEREANEVVLPRIKSAAKAMRKAKRATARNRQRRSQLRTALKRVRAATTTQEAAAAYRTAAQLLDRAGRKNLIHRNAAARQKSRLAKAVAAVKK
jgi:small subunit ribosomal protein S20